MATVRFAIPRLELPARQASPTHRSGKQATHESPPARQATRIHRSGKQATHESSPARQATPTHRSGKQATHESSASKEKAVARTVSGERMERELRHVVKMVQCDQFAKISNVREMHEFEVKSLLAVRQHEDVMSAKIGQLLPGSTLRVLQTGTAFRRAKIWNETVGEGWISLCNPSGACVITSKRAPHIRGHDYGASEMRRDLPVKSAGASMATDPYLLNGGLPKECKNKRAEKTVNFREMWSYEVVSPLNMGHSEQEQSSSVAMLLPGSTVKVVQMGKAPGRAKIWNDTVGEGWISACTPCGRWCIAPEKTHTPKTNHPSGSDRAMSDAQVIENAMRDSKFLFKHAPPDWNRCKPVKKNGIRRGDVESEMAVKHEF